MIRHLTIFLGTFIGGALIALVVRAALFSPHQEATAITPGGDYAPMVTNDLVPTAAAQGAPAPAARAAPADPHAGHAALPAANGASVTTAATAPGQPVNSLCAICGMDVDPSLPTAQYQGQTIGFGCRMCPPKFKANPDRYGPAYLKNELYRP